MDNMFRIASAINRTNLDITIKPEFLVKPELPEVPQSFYECFGEAADPAQILRMTKCVKEYVQFVTKITAPVHTTKSYIVKYIEEGFGDLNIVLAVKNSWHKYKYFDKILPVLNPDGSATFNCSVDTRNRKLDLYRSHKALYAFLGFKKIISCIKPPSNMRKIQVWPGVLDAMQKSLKNGTFMQNYVELMRNFEAQGVFDSINPKIALSKTTDSVPMVNLALCKITYDLFAPLCDWVESKGGNVVFFRPFSMIIFLPNSVEYSDYFSDIELNYTELVD